MVDTLSASDATRKWTNRINTSQGEFSAGIQRTRSWQQPTLQANDSWKTGVSNAASKDLFAKGVSGTSDAEWKDRAGKSASQWAQGAAASSADYGSGISKVLGVIQGTNLSARGPKGTNYGRVQEMGEALRKAKEAGQL